MADNGAKVTMIDNHSENLDIAVRQLSERGGDVRGKVLNVTDRLALRAGIDAAAQYYGKLDVVFANAGIPESAFESVSDERWDLVIDTNLTSIYSTMKACVPHLKIIRKAAVSKSLHRWRQPRPWLPSCRRRRAQQCRAAAVWVEWVEWTIDCAVHP